MTPVRRKQIQKHLRQWVGTSPTTRQQVRPRSVNTNVGHWLDTVLDRHRHPYSLLTHRFWLTTPRLFTGAVRGLSTSAAGSLSGATMGGTPASILGRNRERVLQPSSATSSIATRGHKCFVLHQPSCQVRELPRPLSGPLAPRPHGEKQKPPRTSRSIVIVDAVQRASSRYNADASHPSLADAAGAVKGGQAWTSVMRAAPRAGRLVSEGNHPLLTWCISVLTEVWVA
jgi:hypothetical protein